jgi:hypothetical protein
MKLPQVGVAEREAADFAERAKVLPQPLQVPPAALWVIQ